MGVCVYAVCMCVCVCVCTPPTRPAEPWQTDVVADPNSGRSCFLLVFTFTHNTHTHTHTHTVHARTDTYTRQCVYIKDNNGVIMNLGKQWRRDRQQVTQLCSSESCCIDKRVSFCHGSNNKVCQVSPLSLHSHNEKR